MKVLLAFPQRDKQTGLSLKRAFIQCGCEVNVDVDPKVNSKALLSAVLRYQPNLIFCSRTSALLQGIRQVKDQFPSAVRMCWNVDKRPTVKAFGQSMLELFDEMDIFYTIALGNINEYIQECPHTIVKHLQQGCDPESYYPEGLADDNGHYKCDVMFAGSCTSVHSGRRAVVDAIKTLPIKFNQYGHDGQHRILDSQHNKACQGAKVVIGHNGWSGISISMSVRDYKIMGAKAFLLTEYCPQIEKWFRLGIDCDTYNSPDECVQKVMYYLKYSDKRKEIASTGYDTILAKHTYRHRIEQILKDYKWLNER